MDFWLNIIETIWNVILYAIAWVTQDSTRLNKAKRKTNPEHEAIVQQTRYHLWR